MANKMETQEIVEFRRRLEGSVTEALHNLSHCPRYSNCVTARVTSSLNCSIYGCNVSKEHSALYQICQNMGINGSKERKVMTIGNIRREVSQARYQYRENNK